MQDVTTNTELWEINIRFRRAKKKSEIGPDLFAPPSKDLISIK